MAKDPIRIAVTGAAGKVAYSLLFRIASGSMFGSDQPVCLQLIEVPEAEQVLKGVVMELEDCAFPLLQGIVATHRLDEGFHKAHWVFLVGSHAQKEGMKREDWVKINAKIFYEQGKMIQQHAAFDVRILVVGNPCNTNCWAAHQGAPDIPDNRWFALTRLDADRARNQLANKAGVHASEVSKLAVWGNHSSTIYPDFLNAGISGKPAINVIADNEWLEEKFIQLVHHRRFEIIDILKRPPAASVANAMVKTVDFITRLNIGDDWFSVGVCSDGSYGIPKGLVCSLPIWRKGNEWEIVPNIRFNDFSRVKLKQSIDELIQECEIAKKAIEDGNGQGSRPAKKHGKKTAAHAH